MRLIDQRDAAAEAIDDVVERLHGLRCRVVRKITMPYPDGSRSDMVNATSDVLPQLVEVLDILRDVRLVVNRSAPKAEPAAVE